jgi:hypothetical protein
MPWRGEECNTCHEGDEVVTNEIYPDVRAIEGEPHPKVNNKNS